MAVAIVIQTMFGCWYLLDSFKYNAENIRSHFEVFLNEFSDIHNNSAVLATLMGMMHEVFTRQGYVCSRSQTH